MAGNERVRKYLDAGNVVGQVGRGRAEEIAREWMSAGDIRREQAQEWVDNLAERSRRSSEELLETVRREVAAQLKKIDAKSLENIANQVAEVLRRSAEAGRTATRDVTTQASKTATRARKEATKRAKRARGEVEKTAKRAQREVEKTAKRAQREVEKTAKRARAAAKRVTPRRPAKAGAKKTAAKKAPAKKAPAKKAAAKKAPAKKKSVPAKKSAKKSAKKA